MSGYDNVWKCKCGCMSKKSHRARWAFISIYKRNNTSKYKNSNWDRDNLNSESSLVKKLKIIHTRTNNNQEQLIPIKKVKYDEITKQIVLEIEQSEESEQSEQVEQSEVIEPKKIIIEKDLIELSELFGYNCKRVK